MILKSLKSFEIASESLIDKIHEKHLEKQRVKALEEKIKEMDPDEVAKKVISAVKNFIKNGQKDGMNYAFATGQKADQLMRTLHYQYVGEPGVIHKTTSRLTTVDGVKVVIVTQNDKTTEKPVISQIAFPVTVHTGQITDAVSNFMNAGEIREEIVTRSAMAKLLIQNGISL